MSKPTEKMRSIRCAHQASNTAGFSNILQICVLDENEEAMARLKMAVDEWRRGQVEVEELDLIGPATLDSPAHWKLGAPESQISSHGLESLNAGSPAFRGFNMRLREYLAHHHPLHALRFEDEIKVNSIH
jgi:hypothetical protein